MCDGTQRRRWERKRNRENESKYQCSSTETPRKDLQRRQKQASSSDRLQLSQTSNPILTHNAILSSFKREQGLASSTQEKAPLARNASRYSFVGAAFTERQLVASPPRALRAHGGRSHTPPPPTLFREESCRRGKGSRPATWAFGAPGSTMSTCEANETATASQKDIMEQYNQSVDGITRSNGCIIDPAQPATGSTLSWAANSRLKTMCLKHTKPPILSLVSWIKLPFSWRGPVWRHWHTNSRLRCQLLTGAATTIKTNSGGEQLRRWRAASSATATLAAKLASIIQPGDAGGAALCRYMQDICIIYGNTANCCQPIKLES